MPVQQTTRTLEQAQARVASLERALSDAKAGLPALQAAELRISQILPQAQVQAQAQTQITPFRIMALPKELRELIYKICLPPRRVCIKSRGETEDDMRFDVDANTPWIPRPPFSSTPPPKPPQMPRKHRKTHPLFLVSKLVSTEALKIYRNTSTFYVLAASRSLPVLCGQGPGHDNGPSIPPFEDRFRHLSIAFDVRSFDP